MSLIGVVSTPAPENLSLRQRLEKAGLRRTRATEAVLGLFQSDVSWSPLHAELENALRLGGLQINRVTLYRLLERLVAADVLERHTDAEARAWRFSLSRNQEGVVPRFECDACHRQFQLTEASESTQEVARQLLDSLSHLGHQGQRVDLSIHGTCAVCIDPLQGDPGGESSAVR